MTKGWAQEEHEQEQELETEELGEPKSTEKKITS